MHSTLAKENDVLDRRWLVVRACVSLGSNRWLVNDAQVVGTLQERLVHDTKLSLGSSRCLVDDAKVVGTFQERLVHDTIASLGSSRWLVDDAKVVGTFQERLVHDTKLTFASSRCLDHEAQVGWSQSPSPKSQPLQSRTQRQEIEPPIHFRCDLQTIVAH